MASLGSRVSSAVSAALNSQQSGASAYSSEAAILLRKNKQIQEQQAALDERRVSYKHEIDMLEERTQILQKQKADHYAARIRFDRFTRENDEKRRIALSRMHEERDAESQLRAVLVQIYAIQWAERLRFKCLCDEIEKMRRYEHFLVQVAANSEEFPAADAILQRFQNLKQTRSDLIKKLSFYVEQQDALYSKAEHELYLYQVAKTELQADQSKIIAEIDVHSQQLVQTMNTTGYEIAMERKKVDIGEVMLGIDNLYNRVSEISSLTKTDMRLQSLAEMSPDDAIRYKVKVISDVIGDLAVLELECISKGVINKD